MNNDMYLLDVDDDDDSCLLETQSLERPRFGTVSTVNSCAISALVQEESPDCLPNGRANSPSQMSSQIELNDIPTVVSLTIDDVNAVKQSCLSNFATKWQSQIAKMSSQPISMDDSVVFRRNECPGYQEMRKAEENQSNSKSNQSTRRGLSTGTLGPIFQAGLQGNQRRKPKNYFLVDTTAATGSLPPTATSIVQTQSVKTWLADRSVNCQPTAEVYHSDEALLATASDEISETDISEGPTLSGEDQIKSIDDGMGNFLPNKPSSPHMVKSKSKFRMRSNMMNDVEIDDLDYLDESSSGLLISPDPSHVWLTVPQGSPITSETAIELKTLVLGTYRKSFPDEWTHQDFSLNKNAALKYGLVQKKGGPCGVLACVGAHLIKEVFFNRSWRCSTKSEIPEDEAKKCLALALANILWRCGGNNSAIIALPSNRQVFTDVRPGLCDGLIEKLTLMHFNDLAALQSFLNRHICWYTENNKFACIAFLYSAILSRGITNIKQDMDDSKNCLIGTHDYCSQEVVNLLLTGCASSNVFDNVITLDDGSDSQSVLKGITKSSDIGFLALYEHYNSCQVGSFFKFPRYPVWVICSESHFSILFGKDYFTCEKNSNKPNDANKFDLYYYDGLLNQDTEIKLTIDLLATDGGSFNKNHVPPLEHCIRTKWKGAIVDWNGTEPLL